MSVKERGYYSFMGSVTTVDQQHGTVYGPKSYFCVLSPDKYERICSENPGKERFGNCEHVKRQTFRNLEPYIWASQLSPYVSWGDNSVFDRFASEGSIPSIAACSVDYKALSAEAYQAMKPSLSSKISLTNFILELGDLKRMFQLFDNRKSLSKNVAGGYLNYQFGWKLFIRDVKTIYTKLANWKQVLALYENGQNSIQVRHWSKVIDKRSGMVSQSNPSQYFPMETDYETVTKYTATMKFRYTVPDIKDKYVKIRALLDILGLKLNAGVVWEAIPYSFVVDWFVNVGDVLDAQSDDLLESEVEILDFCSSIKTETTLKIWGRNKYSQIEQGAVRHWVATETSSYYKRMRHIPNISDFGLKLSDRYGSKQVLLSLALLHA